jgi:hypothetical protein
MCGQDFVAESHGQSRYQSTDFLPSFTNASTYGEATELPQPTAKTLRSVSSLAKIPIDVGTSVVIDTDSKTNPALPAVLLGSGDYFSAGALLHSEQRR